MTSDDYLLEGIAIPTRAFERRGFGPMGFSVVIHPSHILEGKKGVAFRKELDANLQIAWGRKPNKDGSVTYDMEVDK